jgi:hypothetical protein
VADVVLGQQSSQRSVAAIGHGAVGHQALRDDAVAAKPGQRALQEGDDGERPFVVEQFAMFQCGRPVSSAEAPVLQGPPCGPTSGPPGGGVDQDCRKASRSALIVSAWVVGMPCGSP